LGAKGIFYVGGREFGEPGNHYLSGQMFVEVYVPQKITKPYPLIFFHGAGQTNTNWLMTPDGRMGWADFFVSKGYVVYLAEQPARGRSAYFPEAVGEQRFHSLEDVELRFTSENGSWPQAKKHTQWPEECRYRTGLGFKAYAQALVKSLKSDKKTQELVLDCAGELLEKTGPAILVTHSQAGPFGWLICDRYPEQVKGIVALEPSGPPFSSDTKIAAARNFGLAELPMCFEPEIKTLENIRLQLILKNNEEQKDGWVFAEPAPQLPNLKNRPVLLLTSEASYHAQYDHLTSYVLKQLGVEHDFVRLENAGIHGNGHMMMLESNNLEIAELISNWLEKVI